MSVRDFIDDPAQHLIAQLNVMPTRRIIALSGMPGSGKSTLAAQIAASVNAEAGPGTLVALGMDGFHLTKATLRQMPNPEEAFARRGAPWTFDVQALAMRLQSLRDAAGVKNVLWPDFQHGVGDPVEDAFTIEPTTRLILVEGLYLLHQKDGWGDVSRQFDERWYLDTPLDVSMRRLADRHIASWGMSREAAEQRINANDRFNAEIVLESRDLCDWRIIGS